MYIYMYGWTESVGEKILARLPRRMFGSLQKRPKRGGFCQIFLCLEYKINVDDMK